MSRILPAAIVLAVLAGAWSQAALGQNTKASDFTRQLYAASDALTKGNFGAQASTAKDLAAAIDKEVAASGKVTPQQLADLKKLQAQLTSLAGMWTSAQKPEKATVLTQQASVIESAVGFFQTIVGEAAKVDPAAGSTTAPAATESLASLKVSLRLEAPPAPPRSATPGGGVRGYPRGGMRGEPTGPVGAMPGGAMPTGTPGIGGALPPAMVDPTGGYAPPGEPGTPGYGTAAQRKVLNITFDMSPIKTFTSIGEMGGFLQLNAAKLDQTPVTFIIAPDVTWQDVSIVLRAFESAPLKGEMKFAGLELRRGGPGMALAATPAAPTEVAPTPAAPLTPTPAVEPTPASTPVAPKPAPVATPGIPDVKLTPDGKLPANMLDMATKPLSKVMYVLDVANDTYPAVKVLVERCIERMQPGPSFGIVVVDAEGKPKTLVPMGRADQAQKERAKAALEAHQPSADKTNLPLLMESIGGAPNPAMNPLYDILILVCDGRKLDPEYGIISLTQPGPPRCFLLIGAGSGGLREGVLSSPEQKLDVISETQLQAIVK